ncbi:hypothetical protein [Capnocytophaga sp.]|uniref:hypothetical protein n=1 Tax=Capnocytophaga sp. TaxID=44737 RepID=UPI0026DB4BC6|nr:hypothetical protein [Capnocytophaga sp.]MDO5106557.1 hypothetical protein [Capnocytophaga sp.]
MKNKLRKITVEGNVYYYRFTDNFQMETSPSFMRLRIFLEGCKATPLVVDFHCKYDLYAGFSLKGTDLYNANTQSTTRVNIHETKYIRQFILLGKQNGWTGNNTTKIQDGMAYLSALGYDIRPILAENTSLFQNNILN